MHTKIIEKGYVHGTSVLFTHRPHGQSMPPYESAHSVNAPGLPVPCRPDMNTSKIAKPATPIAVWPDASQGAADGADTVHLAPFLLENDGTHPTRGAIIVLPGAGYRMRAEHEGDPIARWVNSLGFHALVVSYRVAPHRHPAPMQDAQRAIRIVRQRASEWGIDPDAIGIIGFSAGGHLVATVSTRFDVGQPDATDPLLRVSCRPDFAMLCYPVISFIEQVHQGCIDNLLGPDADEPSRRAMSAELNVTAATPRSFIWHTVEDQAVPVNHPLVYARALGAAGVPYALHVFPAGRHGLGLADGHPAGAWTALAADWMAGLRG